MFSFYISNNNKLGWSNHNESCEITNLDSFYSYWNHISAVIPSTGYVQFYLNGSLMSTDNNSNCQNLPKLI